MIQTSNHLSQAKGLPTSELFPWTPHRPPMVWVDEVLSSSAEGGECLVRLKSDAHYMTDGQLRPTALIEFVAQAQAFVGVHHYKGTGEKFSELKKAFIVSVSDTKMEDTRNFPEIARDQVLKVKIGGHRSIGPITIFKGSVWTSEENCIASVNLKVFCE